MTQKKPSLGRGLTALMGSPDLAQPIASAPAVALVAPGTLPNDGKVIADERKS